MELNPQHPVTQLLHENWHKVCFLLMKRFGQKEVMFTAQEIAMATSSAESSIIAHAKHDGLHIILATEEEAQEAVRRSRQ